MTEKLGLVISILIVTNSLNFFLSLFFPQVIISRVKYMLTLVYTYWTESKAFKKFLFEEITLLKTATVLKISQLLLIKLVKSILNKLAGCGGNP